MYNLYTRYLYFERPNNSKTSSKKSDTVFNGGTLSFRFSRFSSDFALVAKAKSRIEASDFWLKPFDFSTAISYGLKPFDFYASPIKHSDFDDLLISMLLL